MVASTLPGGGRVMRSLLADKISEQMYMDVNVLGQPNDSTCGPTALHSLYHYYGDAISLEQVVKEVHTFEDGGTLAVWLGCHALLRGYDAVLYSCNLQLLDPTWFSSEDVNLVEKLQQQLRYKFDAKLARTSQAFIDFLQYGGVVKLEDLTRDLLRKSLCQGVPILTGLSSTFLYRSPREVPPNQRYDDVQGVPTGHFVVLCGYNRKTKNILIADPLTQNPFSDTRKYEVHIDRVVCAILLGVLTYDANFLLIKPRVNRSYKTLKKDARSESISKLMSVSRP
jgi:hypothetical protein